MRNLTIRDYTPYHTTFEVYKYLSMVDTFLCLPIYIYSIHYLIFRAGKHVKKYRFVLLSTVVWNCLYQQTNAGFAVAWFSTVAVTCPIGWMKWFGIGPLYWQSFMMCLTHALPVSITHLYFHRLKSAIWPSKCYSCINKFGTSFLIFHYIVGFIALPLQVFQAYSANAMGDRTTYEKYFVGLPDFFWSEDCYVSSSPTAAQIQQMPYYNMSMGLAAYVILGDNVLMYFTPVFAIVLVVLKFRKLQTRNAKIQKKLLYALVLQTIVFFVTYIIPSNFGQLSMLDYWFNPTLLQLALFLTQIHGSLVTIAIFLTLKSFRRDLINDICRRKCTASVNSIIDVHTAHKSLSTLLPPVAAPYHNIRQQLP